MTEPMRENFQDRQYPSVAQLLPHGSAFVLLDQIVSFDGESVQCRLVADAVKALGVDLPEIPSSVGIEYMAQAAAALGALKATDSDALQQPGVVIAGKNIDSEIDYFCAGQPLLVCAALTVDHAPLRIFSCQIHCAETNRVLMSGEISIYIFQDLSQLMAQTGG